MNGPRRVRPAGVERPQTPARSRVRTLPHTRERMPTRPRGGSPAGDPPAPRAFARRQGPAAGRVPLPAAGPYISGNEGSRGLSNPVGIHLSFALGLSNEAGPPQASSFGLPRGVV